MRGNSRIIPQPLNSDVEFNRYYNLDLPDLDNLQLWQEERRCEWALTWARPESETCHWLLQRLAAVRDEQRRRRRDHAG